MACECHSTTSDADVVDQLSLLLDVNRTSFCIFLVVAVEAVLCDDDSFVIVNVDQEMEICVVPVSGTTPSVRMIPICLKSSFCDSACRIFCSPDFQGSLKMQLSTL